MTGLTVYSLKSCDTCRKALADMRAAGLTLEVVDIRADGVPAEALERIVAEVGPEVIVNRRSTTWRGLDESARAAAMDPAETARMLTAHPTLMKRPVIVGARVDVGWTAAVRDTVLGG